MFIQEELNLANICSRIACPKFGHPALSLELYNLALNTEFVPAVCMQRKKLHYNSEAETICKPKVH